MLDGIGIRGPADLEKLGVCRLVKHYT